MNKSNQLEPMLNAFLSDLAVLNIKVHNLHWNVEGRVCPHSRNDGKNLQNAAGSI